MSEENNHINYSAVDIEKYHRKELSAAQMHALEKAALDDPFLADAMEGYEARSLETPVESSSSIIDNDINELKKKLSERINEKQNKAVIKYSWWKAAAVVIVFFGAGWLYFFTSNKNKEAKNIIVKNKEIKKEIPLPVETDSVVFPGKKTDTTLANDLAVTEKKKSAQIKKESADNRKITAPDSTAVAALSKPSPRAEVIEKDKAEETVTQKSIESTLKKPVAGLAITDTTNHKSIENNPGLATDNLANKKHKPANAQGFAVNNQAALRVNLSNTFTGTIVDGANRPLANATIQIPDLNIATTTNEKGNFSFKAPDSSLKVSVASAGFETQNMELTTDPIDEENINNIIRLKPSLLTLNEVTVSANGKQKKADLTKAKNITINILDAEPVTGWDDYNQYLEKNKRVPDELKNTHGNVTVLFVVENNGNLKNIRTKKSLNKQLDAEAIRLVTEGPAWKTLTGTKAKVSVTVKF